MDKKVLDVGGLVTATTLNTGICGDENKIPSVSVERLLLFLIQKLETLKIKYQILMV